jgi:hypothetical protein
MIIIIIINKKHDYPNNIILITVSPHLVFRDVTAAHRDISWRARSWR